MFDRIHLWSHLALDFGLLEDFIYLFIYLFFGCVGSSVRARAFSSYGKWGPLFIAVRGPLFIAVRRPFTIAAPPVAGHRLQTRRLSSCGSQAQLLHGVWDLPRPGLEPVSPALAGRFSTTAPPGKPLEDFKLQFQFHYLWIDLFICSNSSWFGLGKLYLSKNLSISPWLCILLAYSCL